MQSIVCLTHTVNKVCTSDGSVIKTTQLLSASI